MEAGGIERISRVCMNGEENEILLCVSKYGYSLYRCSFDPDGGILLNQILRLSLSPVSLGLGSVPKRKEPAWRNIFPSPQSRHAAVSLL